MKNAQISIYIISILLSISLTGCKATSIVGTWEIDESQIEKDNPEIGPFTLEAASSLFSLLEFKDDKQVSFMLFDIEKKWEEKEKNKLVILSKEGDITIYLKDKNNIEIEAVDTQGEKNKKFKFRLKRILKTKGKVKLVTNKIYKTKNKDEQDRNWYIIFLEDVFYQFSTNSSEKINQKIITSEKIEIKGDWGREKGRYIVKGDKVYTITGFGSTKIKIVSQKEIILDNNHLFLTEEK